ncbi:MAG: diguanylate cyclase [Acetatifactor sp.]|nr:diguanylate cyclase [Acetatifactor sp.]
MNGHLIGEEKPDLILLSQTLTGENSVELLRNLQKREDAKRIPVIVMTDSLEPSVEGECLEAGAEDFLSRPLNFQIAHSRIDRIIELNCLKEELQEALKDPLTGMCNRSYAENQISAYLKDHKIGAYFMIDLDNFKQVNDAFGHVAGDEFSLFFYRYFHCREGLCGVVQRCRQGALFFQTKRQK